MRVSNKDLITEYPWLDIGDDRYTLIDMLPTGWHYLVLELCDKLKHKLIGRDLFGKYHVAEAKEKWYMLSWYDYLDDFEPMPEDIVDLIREYEEKSKYICMVCGRLKRASDEVCDVCKTKLERP